ncbi:MAG: discoidin domain-containing protein, partial [Candidatus Omnitrophica bacterium]|nr:discoidin domain-containing protein [Candidatus Omnitrophota bacterium]
SNMRTLPLGLAVLTGQFGANFGMIMAGAVVATVPMLTVYLIFQKYIIKGIPMTGLKGSKKRMKENASIKFSTCAIIVIMLSTVFTGCGKEEAVDVAVTAPKAIQASSADGTLVYIPVSAASASSFDQTPDWAPEPNPMAPVDGDMMTRWSSGYEGGEQWISFDLGGYRVVSDIIVRWERAYAVDYDVMVSNDQKTWDLARAEKNSAGGAVESEFSPVKCRYVKISSTKRVNDAWGVSIWEVEIYGPKDKNPGTVKTKEEYLSGGDEEISRKEVEEAIKKISSAVIPMNVRPFQKGVVYTSWMSDELALPASDLTLTYLKEIGIDTIGIMVPAYQETLVSTEIYTNEGPQGDTPTDQALEHAVKTCHELGMRVMIKPHVDPRTDEARIDILPSEAWFDSYERFITRYAKFSQENGVEIFAIGTELEATTFESWTHRWNALIDKVKSVYAGKLTYAANWTEYAEVPFWDRMDFVGIDAYFPLTNDDNASPQDLAAAWGVIADKIEVWLKNKGLTEKGVILTEIGYPSADGANRQPWAAISSQEDQQEQADCLEAVMKILTARSWFKGYYLWQYFPQDRWSPLGFTVKGKKAEEIIKKWLKVS